MTLRNCNKLFLTNLVLALSIVGAAPSPTLGGPHVDPTADPNGLNRQREIQQQMLDLEDQQRRVEDQRRSLVAKFLEAVKPRRNRFPDFDQVVVHGKAPMTPQLLALMAQSPYAADIAYFLGKHPEQALAIVQMPAPKASLAVKSIESALLADEDHKKL